MKKKLFMQVNGGNQPQMAGMCKRGTKSVAVLGVCLLLAVSGVITGCGSNDKNKVDRRTESMDKNNLSNTQSDMKPDNNSANRNSENNSVTGDTSHKDGQGVVDSLEDVGKDAGDAVEDAGDAAGRAIQGVGDTINDGVNNMMDGTNNRTNDTNR